MKPITNIPTNKLFCVVVNSFMALNEITNVAISFVQIHFINDDTDVTLKKESATAFFACKLVAVAAEPGLSFPPNSVADVVKGPLRLIDGFLVVIDLDASGLFDGDPIQPNVGVMMIQQHTTKMYANAMALF